MPAYNAERFVKSTLETLLSQTYVDWEAVIVDGGSTDGTLGLLDDYAGEYPNLRVFRDRCESPYDAICKGVKKTRGEFIYILCFSDGYLTNEWYKKCMEVMESDPEVALVWGIPFDLFEDPKRNGKGVLRPHYVFSHFLRDGSRYRSAPILKRILGKINLRDLRSILRFVKKLNRTNITAARRLMRPEAVPIKKAWFSYWLETGTIFPDGNMCVARKVLLECLAPYKGGKDVGDWEDFFFTINAKGYLSYCIPIPANFGRINSGQISEMFSETNYRNRLAYFERLKKFREEFRTHPERFAFRDREGNLVQ